MFKKFFNEESFIYSINVFVNFKFTNYFSELFIQVPFRDYLH